jgi:hypothetical protein
MVRFGVSVILIQHIGSPSFYLGVNYCLPEFLCLNSFPALSFRLVFGVEFFEFFTVTLIQPLGFIWTEKSPVLIITDSLHEQIGDPKRIEQISCSLLFLSVIFLELQKLKNVCMPGL